MNHTEILVRLALMEDLGSSNLADNLSSKNDITTSACIDFETKGSAIIISRADGVIAGQWVAKKVFEILDSELEYNEKVFDGTYVSENTVIASLKGRFSSILTGERTALNFLQKLSGVSSLARKISSLVSPYNVSILDTRKTTPAFRELEKRAIVLGGGKNHRMGLYDEFLIKNNHIDALSGDVRLAIKKCRAYKPEAKLKVEVRNISEIKEALSEKPDGLLLDNFTPAQLLEVIKEIRKHENGKEIILEASGGINPENVEMYAKTGINEVSLGFLTHSSQSLDISLRYESSLN